MDLIKEINNLTRVSYNKIAGKYFDLFVDEETGKKFDRDLLDEFARYFKKGSLICDAGCGPVAHTGRYLFNKGLNVIGTDISDKCIEIAAAYNPGMKFIRKDFFEWDFPEEYFDGIISFYSIMYTPRKYINELMEIFHKTLKPNGRLLLAVKEGNIERYVASILGVKTKAFEAFFTAEEIRGYLINNGFEIKYFCDREPYKLEIPIKRLYFIVEKIK